MKKNLFLGILAIALAFVSCGPSTNEGSEYTNLVFTETAIQVGVDATYQLYLDWEPVKAADPTEKCTWTSSDEDVATVSKGMVTGVAQGKCKITATLGELKAVVEVEVLDPIQAERQAIEFTTMVMYNWNPAYIEEHTLEKNVSVDLSIGTVNCDLIERPIYFLASGIAVGDEQIDGADYEIYTLLPVYVINEPAGSANAKYNGYYVGSANGYSVGSKKDAYVMEAGSFASFAKYAEFVDKYMLQEDVEWAQANAEEYYFDNLKGSTLQYHDYDAENSGEVSDGTSWTLGFMTDGVVDWDDDRNLLYIGLTLQWFDDFYGLQVNEEETDVVRPYKYVSSDVVYSNAEYQEAPARRAPRAAAKLTTKSIKSQLSKEFEAYPIKANVKFVK